MSVPEECAPGEYVLVRHYFVTNCLGGNEKGTLTVEASNLADAVAQLFSSDDWHAVHNEALLAEMRNTFGDGSSQ